MKPGSLIIKQRWLIITVTLLVVGLACLPLLRIETNSDLMSYLPEDMESRVNDAKVTEIFGTAEPLIIMLETDDVLAEATLKRLRDLSKAFNRMDDFTMVMSLYDAKNIQGEYGAMVVDPVYKRIPKTEARREALRDRIRENEMAFGLVVSEDFRYTMILLNSNGETPDEELMSLVNGVLKEHPGEEKVSMFGMPFLRDEANKKIARDMMILLPLGILLMLAFLYFSFRQKRGAILPFLVVLFSGIISMAVIPLAGWELSIIGVLIPILMIAIANNYGVHFITRYQELVARSPGANGKEVVLEAWRYLRSPIVLTGLTTMAGISGLIAHLLLPAKQMGVAAAIGIGFALIFSLSFLPALLSVLKTGKVPSGAGGNGGSWLGKSLGKVAALVTSSPKKVLLGFGLFLLLCSVGLTRFELEASLNRLFPHSHPYNQCFEVVTEHFGGTRNTNIVFKGDIKDPDLLKRMLEYEDSLENNPEVGCVNSIATVIRIMSRAINEPGDPYYNTIPDSREGVAQYLELYSMSGDPEDFESLVDFDYSHAIMSIQFKAKGMKELKAMDQKLMEMCGNDPALQLIAGSSYLDMDLATSIARGQFTSLAFAFVAILILLVLIFKSVRAGLLGTLPLLFTVLATFGLMGWLGIQLNIVTALLSSISIGLGVDYSIHLFWRVKSELSQGSSYQEAVSISLRTIGRGITINAFSVILGFSVLLVSSFPYIRYFGILIMISLLMCLLGALVLVPAIIVLRRPAFLARSKKTTNKTRLMKPLRKAMLCMVFGLGITALSYGQSAGEVIDRSLDAVELSAMEMTATLKIIDAKGRERIRETATATREFDGVSKTLMKFIAPADVKGTTMLIYDHDTRDDDMWIYMPAIRKTRRIVSSDKGNNFMGSEFSNADMSRPNPADFEYELMADQNYKGRECWVVRSDCRTEDIEDQNGYTYTLTWIDKINYLSHKVDYFDLDGEKEKVRTIDNYEKQANGKYMAKLMSMENVQNGRKSILTVTRLVASSKLPESAFSPTMLEQ